MLQLQQQPEPRRREAKRHSRCAWELRARDLPRMNRVMLLRARTTLLKLAADLVRWPRCAWSFLQSVAEIEAELTHRGYYFEPHDVRLLND